MREVCQAGAGAERGSPAGFGRRRRGIGGERGQATIEFAGTAIWIVLAALFAWQLALLAWTATSATGAARTGSRVAGRGGDGGAAAMQALSGPLRGGATVTMAVDRATVRVRVPIVFPGLQPLNFAITESADLPGTG